MQTNCLFNRTPVEQYVVSRFIHLPVLRDHETVDKFSKWATTSPFLSWHECHIQPWHFIYLHSSFFPMQVILGIGYYDSWAASSSQHRNKRKIVKIRGVDDHTYIDCTLYNNAYNISLVWISIKKYIYRQCLLVVIEKEVSKDCHKSTFLIRVIINHRPTLLKWRVRIAYYTSEHLAVILLFFMQQIFF